MDHGIIDLLSLFHFLLYFCIGLFYKDKYLIIFIIGIIWEIFEKFIITTEYTRDLLLEYWFIPELYINDTLEHSIVDIIINMIGYTIGNKISIK
tara:strand:- start:503 stop:784 length:282 start_codon:yes stop_codon:yes gene_type:complete